MSKSRDQRERDAAKAAVTQEKQEQKNLPTTPVETPKPEVKKPEVKPEKPVPLGELTEEELANIAKNVNDEIKRRDEARRKADEEKRKIEEEAEKKEAEKTARIVAAVLAQMGIQPSAPEKSEPVSEPVVKPETPVEEPKATETEKVEEEAKAQHEAEFAAGEPGKKVETFEEKLEKYGIRKAYLYHYLENGEIKDDTAFSPLEARVASFDDSWDLTYVWVDKETGKKVKALTKEEARKYLALRRG